MHREGLGPQVGLANSVATDQKLHCPGQHWELIAKASNGQGLIWPKSRRSQPSEERGFCSLLRSLMWSCSGQGSIKKLVICD